MPPRNEYQVTARIRRKASDEGWTYRELPTFVIPSTIAASIRDARLTALAIIDPFGDSLVIMEIWNAATGEMGEMSERVDREHAD